MRTICRTEGMTTSFIIADLAPEYHQAVLGLYYSPGEDGFSKSFPAVTPHLDRIYRNFERSAAALVRQAARNCPIPWEATLLDFLALIEGKEPNWWLVGSAALAVRGIDVIPGDLDLVVDDAGAARLGEWLLAYLVEPVLPTPGWIGACFGRAFLHSRLEWVGGVHDWVDTPEPSDFGPIAQNRCEVVTWRGKKIRVPPLDLQLAVCRRRGLDERADKIEKFMKGNGQS